MINQEFAKEKISHESNEDVITLYDGTNVAVRSAGMDDVELIHEMHERLSTDSVYYRYLGPFKPTTKDLIHQCSLDGGPGFALIATVKEPHEKIVAIACYRGEAQNPASAEPAILVEDAYQGRGLGKRFFLALCDQAARRGVKVFESYAHPNNQAVMHMIEKCGLSFESKYNQGLKEIRIRL